MPCVFGAENAASRSKLAREATLRFLALELLRLAGQAGERGGAPRLSLTEGVGLETSSLFEAMR